MITGFLWSFIAIVLYLKSNFKGRVKLNFIIVLIFDDDYLTYTSFQTGGLINNRCQSGCPRKRKPVNRKRWYSSNRNWYVLDNPVFGVGVAKGAEVRSRNWEFCSVSWWNYKDAGWAWVFGIVGLLILFITTDIVSEYKFNLFLLCFLAFWFLTINHAAMRTAIPLCVFFVFVERAISWKKK
jgi:hypothetical protein